MPAKSSGIRLAGDSHCCHTSMVRTLSRYARYGVTALWVIAGGWLAGATAGEVRHAWLVVPTPPEIIKEVVVRNVKDEEGKKASFRIMLFSDEFRWRINSFDASRPPPFPSLLNR